MSEVSHTTSLSGVAPDKHATPPTAPVFGTPELCAPEFGAADHDSISIQLGKNSIKIPTKNSLVLGFSMGLLLCLLMIFGLVGAAFYLALA